MSFLFRIGALASFAALCATHPGGAASSSELGWLAGCWSSQDAEPGTEEHWLAPAGGTLLGMSRTVRNGRTVAHEFMQIRESGPGRLVFIAHPSGQAEASFPLVRLTATEAVFEDPAHDFPQRVIYRLDGRTLRARIEGRRDGEVTAIDFPMDRIPCEGRS
jgi:hypothetical protein